MQKTILVSGIEDTETKVTLLEDSGMKYPNKYSFFKKYNDGTGNSTDTFDQFQDLKIQAGKSYVVEIKEVPGVNKANNPVVYKNIVSFINSSVKTQPEAFSSPTKQTNAQKQVDNNLNRNIMGFEAKKEDNMRTMASGRDAVLITTSFYKENPLTDEQIQEKIKFWAKWMNDAIYNVPFVG